MTGFLSDPSSHSLDAVADRFRQFADQCKTYPLYRRLSLGIAQDREVLSIASHVTQHQPVPNMLLSSVQYLLLEDPFHPLTRFYPYFYGRQSNSASDPYPHFHNFCLLHRERILDLLTTHRLQTNEPARCALWIPLLALVMQRFEGQSLAWLEVGASAGLNLNWQHYGYDYGSLGQYGSADSPLILRCEIRGSQRPPLPKRSPMVGWCTGVDPDPVRLDDKHALRWLQACIFADQVERFPRLSAAIDIAKQHPVEVIVGDALELLPDLIGNIPAPLHLCIAHSFVANQLSVEQRQELETIIINGSLRRDISRLTLEWLSDTPFPELGLYHYVGGHVEGGILAQCHYHGDWLEWVA